MRFLTLSLALIPAALAAPVPAPAPSTRVDARITRNGQNLTCRPTEYRLPGVSWRPGREYPYRRRCGGLLPEP